MCLYFEFVNVETPQRRDLVLKHLDLASLGFIQATETSMQGKKEIISRRPVIFIVINKYS